MIRRFTLPLVLMLLAIVFWYNPNVKEIAAGVAILLFGMIALENGFRTFAEGPLKKFLKKATDKFYKSLTVGMVSTAILQSSSLISVIAISFISAGLLDLIGGIGIIFGANIGTTATAWLVAIFGLKIKISALAMPMLVFGVVLYFQKKPSYQAFGNILAGLGFLFLGIHFMKQGFDAYSGDISLSQYQMGGFLGMIVFVGIGLLSTVILQSSSAAMAIILTALSAGQITYFDSLALAVGANVGTTITAIIGAAASNVAGKRVAGAHLVFNVVTGLIALIFIYQFIWSVDEIASQVGIRSDDYILKLAIFHTLFNTVGVLVMYPFVRPMARGLVRLIPDKDGKGIDQPKYLTEAALRYPTSAIEALANETQHLIDNAINVIAHGLRLHRRDVLSDMPSKEVIHVPAYSKEINMDEVYMNKIKTIYSRIIEVATLTQQSEMPAEDIEKIYHIKEANRFLVDVIKDVKEIRPNMIRFLKSDNKYMRNEYDKFRRRIIKTIRVVYKTTSFEPPLEMSDEEIEKLRGQYIETRGIKLKKQQKKIRENDVLFNGTLDKLVRNKAITSNMASSLINDSATVARINRYLITMAELLYVDSDLLLINENGHELDDDGNDQISVDQEQSAGS